LGALATNHILTARDVGRNSRQNKGSKERTKKYIDGEKGEKKKKGNNTDGSRCPEAEAPCMVLAALPVVD
jgi:hypothetical protein